MASLAEIALQLQVQYSTDEPRGVGCILVRKSVGVEARGCIDDD
jgi:hypothetical protein